MNLFELLRLRFAARKVDEDIPFEEDLSAYTREEIWGFLTHAELIAAAAREIVDWLRTDLASRFEEGEIVRFGPTVYSVSASPKERIVDPAALVAFLEDDWPHVIPVTSSTRLRQGGLKAVLERRGVDLESFRETFLDVEWDSPKLKAVPLSKAPKYAQGMEHGESRHR